MVDNAAERKILAPSVYVDGFARDHVPPENLWPEIPRDLPEFTYPKYINAAVELLDAMIDRGHGARACVRGSTDVVWSYDDLRDHAERMAAALVAEYG